MNSRPDSQTTHLPVAVVGMSGRFPDAHDVHALWQNLADGKCSVRQFAAPQLKSWGGDERKLREPNFVMAGAYLEDIDLFDADFFGFEAQAAEFTDPQHRLFLQCAWHALESAGYPTDSSDFRVGVFAGAAQSAYPARQLSIPTRLARASGAARIAANEADSLAAMVSHKLGLHGPSVSVQTFCSTSLVAVHLACQSLASHECELAMAGGITLTLPHERGYVYQDGGLLSPNGCCRPFDEQADGTVVGDGVAVVVLRRLDDAIADRDDVQAVIRGSAISYDQPDDSGDGASRVARQARLMQTALVRAGVTPQSIQYVEADAIGVPDADQIEFAALKQAYQRSATEPLAIGSLKPNLGHLDRAAGVAGLMKAILALRHGQLPPTLNFEQAHHGLEFERSHLYVNTALSPWPKCEGRRRAAVSSFGWGGANAHVVLEEPPSAPPAGPPPHQHLLVLSAGNASDLQQTTQHLANHLQEHPDVNLGDVAYTLQVGRRSYRHRRFCVSSDCSTALEMLTALTPGKVWTSQTLVNDRPVVYLFPGVGGQYAGMGKGLYDSEPTFRAAVDTCAEILREPLGEDIRELLYPSADGDAPPPQASGDQWDLRAMLGRQRAAEPADELFSRTSLAHSCLFVMEYALVQLLQAWGIRPQAMIGHSLGEYTAACVAGVFSLEQGLKLLVRRARRIESLPAGSMLGVALSEDEVRPFLNDDLDLAAVNSDQAVVVSGSVPAMASLAERFEQEQVAFRRMPATRAFHSRMLEAAADELYELFAAMDLKSPTIPLISCASGQWMTADQVTDPRYWARQMCHTVRFADGLEQIMKLGTHFLLEVGPGETLGSLAKQHAACAADRIPMIQGAMRSVHQAQDDTAFLLNTLGHMWLSGVTPDWHGLHGDRKRGRIPLPTRSLRCKRYWIEPAAGPARDMSVGAISSRSPDTTSSPPHAVRHERLKDLADWQHVCCWRESYPHHAPAVKHSFATGECYLLFHDDSACGLQLHRSLIDAGCRTIGVLPASSFAQRDAETYEMRPAERSDYDRLLQMVADSGRSVAKVIHAWSLAGHAGRDEGRAHDLAQAMDLGLLSILTTVQCLADRDAEPCEVIALTNELHDITGREQTRDVDATILGACRVVRHEYARIGCRNVDIELSTVQAEDAWQKLLDEIFSPCGEPVVALRGHHRWVESFSPVRLAELDTSAPPYRAGGVYLITGGFGGIGLALGRHLAKAARAKVVLVGRTGPPAAGGRVPAARRQHISAQIKDIEEAGGEVFPLTADVGSEQQMRETVRKVVHRYGNIHGIFHLAGVPPSGLIQFKSPEALRDVLHPKVSGTIALAHALETLSLDFLVLFSSLSSVSGGGAGQVDYCAANAFLDVFARSHRGQYGKCVAISWDHWQWDAWQDGLWGFPEETRQLLVDRRRSYGITFDEGCEVLDRILLGPWHHVAVATRGMQSVMAESQALSVTAVLQRLDAWRRSRPSTPRPELGEEYIAAATEIERKIVAMWEELLGIERVGLDDDFFELGGDSLLAVSVLERYRTEFPRAAVTAQMFWDNPTVRTLVQHTSPG